MSEELNDKILEYAQDLEFIKWVQTGFVYKNEYWLGLKADGDLAFSIDQAIELVKQINFTTTTSSPKRKKELFDRITDSIEKETVELKPSTGRRRFLYPISVAASIALLVFFFWPNASITSIQTAFAESMTYQLPDNSEFIINSESKISFDKSNFRDKRILALEGEAFFNVQKGESFIVQTRTGSIEVLGTSFNVYARGETLEVVCETGKVKVSSEDKNSSTILTAGKSCKLKSGKIISESESMNSSWRNGIFNFQNNRLGRVVSEIERQFEVRIKLSDEIADLNYTGFFEKGNLDKALESVLWPLKLKYSYNSDKQIEIEKN